MPTTTFHNLPTEKRERLLAAARAEFARAPYEDASVNRIIRAAGIPRGSFYMYFTDKEELFHFLMETYRRQLEDWLGERLERDGGDLFAACLALYDFILDNRQARPVLELAAILRRNRQRMPALLLPQSGLEAVQDRLRDRIDLSRLDLRTESDLADIFRLLLSAVAGALAPLCAGGGPEEARERLARVFAILARGAAAKPASPL